MNAQLTAEQVRPPTSQQSSSPNTRGRDDMPEPDRGPHLPGPHLPGPHLPGPHLPGPQLPDAHLPGQRFVSRELVHKAAAEHVLLTDGVRHAPDTFLITATLPRDHCLYEQDDCGRIDPMLPTEAFRQAAYYVQHRFYEVPETHKFILGGVTLDIGEATLPTGTSRLPLGLRVTCTPTAKSTRRRLCMRLDVELSVAGEVCGRGSLLSQAVDPRMYQAIRGRKPAPAPAPTTSHPFIGYPLSPGEVGRRRKEDVLLADDGDPGGRLLQLDQSNTEMVDHAVDHVQGMVVLEAFRQAALAATRPLTGRRASLTGLRVEFARFCELDAPVRIAATPQPGRPGADRMAVRVLAEQDGEEVAAGTMELRLGPDTTSGQDRR
ncbi:ScbA/BarX family gamma-butyrolactone biosynthesis protein [Sphaerisporangium sp. NPDC005289]|uniref:ScbA/BarX family gamma-butyrolactone biosynthesis protein n=1 Tax=Sphaerisporangium sp. NPDC005289 TaxID=3155247 RepID=UPI0033B0CF78